MENTKASEEYRAVNHANWESRVPAHAASKQYGLARFVDDPAHLSDVVRFDLPRLGGIADLDVAHLQCHIGTDTISLARLGARVVLGSTTPCRGMRWAMRCARWAVASGDCSTGLNDCRARTRCVLASDDLR